MQAKELEHERALSTIQQLEEALRDARAQAGESPSRPALQIPASAAKVKQDHKRREGGDSDTDDDEYSRNMYDSPMNRGKRALQQQQMQLKSRRLFARGAHVRGNRHALGTLADQRHQAFCKGDNQRENGRNPGAREDRSHL